MQSLSVEQSLIFQLKSLLKKKNLNQFQVLLVVNLAFKRMHLHVLLVHEYLMHMFPCKNYVLEQENDLFRKASPGIN